MEFSLLLEGSRRKGVETRSLPSDGPHRHQLDRLEHISLSLTLIQTWGGWQTCHRTPLSWRKGLTVGALVSTNSSSSSLLLQPSPQTFQRSVYSNSPHGVLQVDITKPPAYPRLPSTGAWHKVSLIPGDTRDTRRHDLINTRARRACQRGLCASLTVGTSRQVVLICLLDR